MWASASIARISTVPKSGDVVRTSYQSQVSLITPASTMN